MLPLRQPCPFSHICPLRTCLREDERWRRLVGPLSCGTDASRRPLNPILACRFFQYMTFYMVALQLVQFSLAVVADALPLVSTSLSW